MAMPVVTNMAVPKPWRMRTPISIGIDIENAPISDASVYIARPYLKTFFRPYMSPIFPIGIRKIATVRSSAVATQLSVTASAENSF